MHVLHGAKTNCEPAAENKCKSKPKMDTSKKMHSDSMSCSSSSEDPSQSTFTEYQYSLATRSGASLVTIGAVLTAALLG